MRNRLKALYYAVSFMTHQLTLFPKTARTLASVLGALTVLSTAHAANFDECKENFYAGYIPQPSEQHPGKQRALCFDDFAVLHSGVSKTAVYAAEYLTPARLRQAKEFKRTDRFYEEARLPNAERAKLADYHRSGLDRGHLAAAAQRHTKEGMAQSFSLANMVPQFPDHNRGPWAKSVEKATRQYAERSAQGVYVITGPIYRGTPAQIGPNKVWVPSSLFKLVYDPAKKKAWAYDLENTNEAKVRGTISYDELVLRTGIHFLPQGALR